MIKLYTADLCPYAQRVRALLVRLGQPFETAFIDLANRPEEFIAMTPTGKVPLLLEGDLKLYESLVIMEYLAARNEWKEAWSQDHGVRGRQRLALKQWDAVVLPAWYRGLQTPSSFEGRIRDRVEAEIGELDRTVRLFKDEVDCIPGYHLAPFWATIVWTRESSPLAEIIDGCPDLKGWLDRALALPAVQQTLPDREAAVRACTASPSGPPNKT